MTAGPASPARFAHRSARCADLTCPPSNIRASSASCGLGDRRLSAPDPAGAPARGPRPQRIQRWRDARPPYKLHSGSPAVQFNGGLASATRRKTSILLGSEPHPVCNEDLRNAGRALYVRGAHDVSRGGIASCIETSIIAPADTAVLDGVSPAQFQATDPRVWVARVRWYLT